MAELSALFLAAFLAATPLPMNSELPFLALLAAGSQDPWVLVAVASLANTLGSCLTYAVGRVAGVGLRGSRWFPVTPGALSKAEGWFARWGALALLVSWLPGGDVAVALAGMLRLPLRLFLPLVAIGKTARYAALAIAGEGLLALF